MNLKITQRCSGCLMTFTNLPKSKDFWLTGFYSKKVLAAYFDSCKKSCEGVIKKKTRRRKNSYFLIFRKGLKPTDHLETIGSFKKIMTLSFHWYKTPFCSLSSTVKY